MVAKKQSKRVGHSRVSSRRIKAGNGDFELISLFLKNSGCDRKKSADPQNPPNFVDTGIDLRLVAKKGQDVVSVAVSLSMGGKYKKDDPEPAISLMALFVASYKVKRKQSESAIVRQLSRQAVLNVWPYWREFAQNMTVRMGMPPVGVPLIFPHSLDDLEITPLTTDKRSAKPKKTDRD